MISVLAALALLVTAPDPQDGPWRQLIDFVPTAERPDGTSLFLLEADMLPQGSPARREARPLRYLWVNHGAVVGDQAVTLVTGTTDCDRYLTACDMVEGRDVEPCVARYPLVQRGAEVVTEGHPTILVWLVNGEPHVARLPMAE